MRGALERRVVERDEGWCAKEVLKVLEREKWDGENGEEGGDHECLLSEFILSDEGF